MNKILLLCLISFLFSQHIQAQNKYGQLGLSLGIAFPLGEFSSKDLKNINAGWANSGSSLQLTYQYQFDKSYFGLTALVHGQSNPFDAQQMEKECLNYFPSYTWTIEGTAWRIGALMLGGFAAFPISEKVKFTPRVLAGVMNTKSSDIMVKGIENGNLTWGNQKSSTSNSIIYLFGAGFQFKLSNKLKLQTNLDYFASNPEFNNIEIIRSDGSRISNTLKPSISNINLNLGLGLDL